MAKNRLGRVAHSLLWEFTSLSDVHICPIVYIK